MPLGRSIDDQIKELKQRGTNYYRNQFNERAGSSLNSAKQREEGFGFRGPTGINAGFEAPEVTQARDAEKLQRLISQKNAPRVAATPKTNSLSRISPLSSYIDQNQFEQINPLIAEDEAVRGVEQEFTGARQRELREFGRIGVSPTAGRARSSSQRRALNLALARSGARLESRKATDASNLQREQAGRELALATRDQDITQRGQDITAQTARRSKSSPRQPYIVSAPTGPTQINRR